MSVTEISSSTLQQVNIDSDIIINGAVEQHASGMVSIKIDQATYQTLNFLRAKALENSQKPYQASEGSFSYHVEIISAEEGMPLFSKLKSKLTTLHSKSIDNTHKLRAYIKETFLQKPSTIMAQKRNSNELVMNIVCSKAANIFRKLFNLKAKTEFSLISTFVVQETQKPLCEELVKEKQEKITGANPNETAAAPYATACILARN